MVDDTGTRSLAHIRDDDGELPKYAWPGGYPIFYLTEDNSVLCPDCANGRHGSEAADPDGQTDPPWSIVAHECNWEDPELYCDHCHERIESAYAEDEVEASEQD